MGVCRPLRQQRLHGEVDALAFEVHVEDFDAHLLLRPEREGFLGVDPAAPEDDLVAVFRLQRPRIHAGGRALDRVEDVEPARDKMRNEPGNRADKSLTTVSPPIPESNTPIIFPSNPSGNG